MFEYEIISGLACLRTSYGDLSISKDSFIGFKPIELFVSALVGCSASIFTTILGKKRIKVDKIRIKANVERDVQTANKITEVEILFIVEGTNLIFEQLKKVLDITIKNCGMIQSVNRSINIKESIKVVIPS